MNATRNLHHLSSFHLVLVSKIEDQTCQNNVKRTALRLLSLFVISPNVPVLPENYNKLQPSFPGQRMNRINSVGFIFPMVFQV